MTLLHLHSDPAEHEQLQRARGLALLDQGRVRAGERRLFVECGDGWIVEEAWRRVRRGYLCGVDRSAALVARANALRAVPGAVEFDTWDGRRLPCRTGSFAHVMSTFTMERDGDPTEALVEMHRVLQPGATVELLTPPDSAASLARLLRRAHFQDIAEVSGCRIDVARCEINLTSGAHAVATLVRARSPLTRRSPTAVPTTAG